ncbi:MAG: hypothetical protein ABIZ95_08780, partial [Pyrinomonadaceae bacterium]
MRMRLSVHLVIGICLVCMAGVSVAQEPADPTPGSSGTVYGTVREVTNQYIRVQTPGDIGRRYYFPWVENPAVTTQPAPSVAVDQTVAVKWSFDDRRRVVSVAPSTLPAAPKPDASGAQVSAREEHQESPSTAPSASSGGVKSTGDTVNAMIDGLLATGERL